MPKLKDVKEKKKEIYANLSGESGVISYYLLPKSISVTFHDGDSYVYTETVPGPEHFFEMTMRAGFGIGLNTYINQHVRDAYFFKL